MRHTTERLQSTSELFPAQKHGPWTQMVEPDGCNNQMKLGQDKLCLNGKQLQVPVAGREQDKSNCTAWFGSRCGHGSVLQSYFSGREANNTVTSFPFPGFLPDHTTWRQGARGVRAMMLQLHDPGCQQTSTKLPQPFALSLISPVVLSFPIKFLSLSKMTTFFFQ